LSPSFSPSDCATSVAVAVPNARHAVKVSLRTPTITEVAAAFTGSAAPHIGDDGRGEAHVELASDLGEEAEARHHGDGRDGARDREAEDDQVRLRVVFTKIEGVELGAVLGLERVDDHDEQADVGGDEAREARRPRCPSCERRAPVAEDEDDAER
jgi:hypothetical protein